MDTCQNIRRYFDFLDALRSSFEIVESVFINDELNNEYIKAM